MNRVPSDSAAFAAFSCAAAIAVVLLPGCAPFDVNVGTNEPLKVELNMEVHVYQHDETDPAEKAKRDSYKEVIKARRDRTEEIQELKDNRLVGETREGLLEIRNLPGGAWGERAKVAVTEENEDRDFLIEYEATQKGVPDEEIRRMQWRHWQRKSFPGEWIQVESETEGEYEWAQKQGASEETDSAETEPEPEAGAEN